MAAAVGTAEHRNSLERHEEMGQKHWLRRHLGYLWTGPADWSTAEKTCQEHGGHLVHIQSYGENGRALEEFGRGARGAKDETEQPQGVCYSSAPPFSARS